MRKTLILALAAMAVGLGGCNVMRGQQGVGEYADDAALTARVKAALLDNESVKGTDINVNVYQGKVQLSGFADSSAEKSTAERVARSVDGVRGVENNIELKGSGAGKGSSGGSDTSPSTNPSGDSTPSSDTTGSPPRS